MATDIKISPKAVYEMADNMYKKLKEAEDNSVALCRTFKNCATGNKGKSYWNGERAFKWYCAAVRSCANSHFRLAKMAGIYKKMCEDAIKVQQADNPKSKVVLDLQTKVVRLGDLKRRCEGNYKSVIDWAKS